MKNNKNYLIIIAIVLLLILNIFLIFKKNTSVIEKSKINKIERKEFNIYLQQTVGSEDYNPSSSESFPSQGYLLNSEKTECYDYNGKGTTYKPTQNFVNEVIDGSITIESSNTIYCNLYFDKNETPTISKFDVTGKTSGNQNLTNGFTYQTDSLPFNIEYTDTESDVKQYCISETEGSDNCNWQTLNEANSYSLKDNKDGLKTMYIYLKDKANNISEVSQDTITVDKTKPVVTSFTLTGTADENQALSNSSQYTHKSKITYNAGINETNIDSYCVYENSGCSYIETTEKEITKKEYNLTENEGIKTLSIKVKDKAGNESEVNINSTKTITLDLQNPTSTIEEKSVTTNSITVTVSGEDKTPNSSIIEKQCRLNGTDNWTNAEEDGSCTIDKSSNGQELKDGTAYTIEARVRDTSGRYSQTPYPNISVTTDKRGTTGKDLYNSLNGSNIVIDCNGMKRYYGTKEQVNNWVCFGYNDASTDCSGETSDYMYRIIGITSNGEIKLIKNKALASTYQWHRDWTSKRAWDQSDLYKNINGTIFLTNLLSGWQDKIMKYTWPQGDITSGNKTASALCSEESNFQTINAKIGLMSLSDYYYAYNGANSNCSSSCSTNWMFIKNNENTDLNSNVYEWTIQNYGYDSAIDAYCAWTVKREGDAYSYMSYNGGFLVRPVFYLSPETLISSSSGTSSDPIIIYF